MRSLDIDSTLSLQWGAKPGKIDWLKLEAVLVEILNLDDTADERVALAKEAIDAFTRRGNFIDQPHYGRFGPISSASFALRAEADDK